MADKERRKDIRRAQPETQHYTTQPGDMVGGIALRQLGNESRWTDIRDLNPSEDIETPHDMFEVGTVLVIRQQLQVRPAAPLQADLHQDVAVEGPPFSATDVHALIRQAGGVVHANGNIAFSNWERFVCAAVCVSEASVATVEAAQRMLTELRAIREALQFANETPRGPITDTIWMLHRPQTVFDALDECIDLLAPSQAQPSAGGPNG